MATPTTLPSTFVAGNVLTAAEMNALRGAFRILQVVRATDTTLRTTTSNSYVDANISVTITPTSATSDILLIWSASVDVQGTGASNVIVMGITDSSNNLLSGAEKSQFGPITADRQVNQLIAIGYDSPATTSPTTYKGRFYASSGTTGELENADNTGQMFALEISA